MTSPLLPQSSSSLCCQVKYTVVAQVMGIDRSQDNIGILWPWIQGTTNPKNK